jgi:transcriptional regulator with AAA-type ATPase domain
MVVIPLHRLADHPQQKYNVRFAFNRLMLRMQHRAVDKADIKLVWPEGAIDLRAVMQQQSKPNARAAASKSPAAQQVSHMSEHINWLDQGVSQNQEQALAVREVVKRNYGDKSQPMLLFGAFGTGKTRYAPMHSLNPGNSHSLHFTEPWLRR